MVGRIESYIHSDKVTQNKGAAIVKISCDTDFCAKTDPFVEFSKEVAKFSFAAKNESFDKVCELFPLKEKLDILKKELGENIVVEDIKILSF